MCSAMPAVEARGCVTMACVQPFRQAELQKSLCRREIVNTVDAFLVVEFLEELTLWDGGFHGVGFCAPAEPTNALARAMILR